MSTPPANQPFIAYEIHAGYGMKLAPAPVTRPWMDETDHRYAYRCLPLVIANQSGWWLHNAVAFTARWNGGSAKGDTTLDFGPGRSDARVVSHFGSGIITFSLPFLFRTPPGINLWAKGPTNYIKDGVQPLEGVIETDWSESTFTMNWKLTRPDCDVTFAVEEPVCMIVPVLRGLADALESRIVPLASDVELHRRYAQWDEGRRAFQQALDARDPDTVKRGWQRDYFAGIAADGSRVEGHESKLNLREFHRENELPPG